MGTLFFTEKIKYRFEGKEERGIYVSREESSYFAGDTFFDETPMSAKSNPMKLGKQGEKICKYVRHPAKTFNAALGGSVGDAPKSQETLKKDKFPGVRGSKQNPSEKIKSYPTVGRLIQ